MTEDEVTAAAMADALEAMARRIAREEIASLAGKALRRLQDESFSRSFTRNEATDAAKDVAGHFWAEILAEYGAKVEGELDA